jgi:hypothetical protein
MYGFYGMLFAYTPFALVNLNLFKIRVEFQNKFYKADGYKFNPYSFKYIIEEI